MHAVIFDLDHTIFTADQTLHDGVQELLNILRQLGVKMGAVSNNDHRVLVRLDEAGIRHHFADVMCAAQHDAPKSIESLHRLLQNMGAHLDETVLVSHAHADILLAKDAGLAKTIGVSHGTANTAPLQEAGADHIVQGIPAILDVLG